MHALKLAAQHPETCDGVAVHAATLPERPDVVSDGVAQKQLWVALFVGAQDANFSVESGRQTLHWLTQAGANATFYIIKNHTHWYYADAHTINQAVWHFLTY